MDAVRGPDSICPTVDLPAEAPPDVILTRLVETYQTALLRICYMILRDEALAEDAVQEAICAAFAHRDRLRDPESFKPWLLRILANQCYDVCRGRRPAVDLAEVQEFLPAEGTDPTEGITLWQAVLSLPAEQRTVVTLFYYESLSVREISGILKISEGAVKTRLSRARARLRELLREE